MASKFGKIEVLNYKTDRIVGALCIMQSKGATLGNPFYKMRNRHSSIRKFRRYLYDHIKKRSNVHSELMRLTRMYLNGEKVRIYCCCKPLPCHGDVIADAIRWLAKNIEKNLRFELLCNKCAHRGVPNLEESGPHTKALCSNPDCGAYIKFLSASELKQITGV